MSYVLSFSLFHFSHFVLGRTHPQFWGWKEWFWGSKMSIDQMIVGGVGMWISIEIHINGGKLPLLNGLKIRFFRLWHAARVSGSKVGYTIPF